MPLVPFIYHTILDTFRMGMDKKILSDILSKSTGRCWSIDTYNPVPGVLEGVPASRDYDGGTF